jgi:hypothetical protein
MNRLGFSGGASPEFGDYLIQDANRCGFHVNRPEFGSCPIGRTSRSPHLVLRAMGMARRGFPFSPTRTSSCTAADSAALPSDATHRLRHPKAKPGVLRLSSLWNSLAALLTGSAEQPSSIGRTDRPCGGHSLARPERAAQPPECYVDRIHRSLYELRCRRSSPPPPNMQRQVRFSPCCSALSPVAAVRNLKSQTSRLLQYRRSASASCLAGEDGPKCVARPTRSARRGHSRSRTRVDKLGPAGPRTRARRDRELALVCGVAFVARATRPQAPRACREFLRRIGSRRLAQSHRRLQDLCVVDGRSSRRSEAPARLGCSRWAAGHAGQRRVADHGRGGSGE